MPTESQGRAGRRPGPVCSRFTPAALLGLVLLAAVGQAPAQEPPAGRPGSYSFGVLPMLPAARLEAVFAPIAGELGRALGRSIRYRSAATYPQFEERLARGEFDVAHIQPFDYVRTAAASGYLPVAGRNDALAAIAVVPAESRVTGLAQLAGATVAMPAERAAVTTLGKAVLLESGIDPGRDLTLSFSDDHHSCIQKAVTGVAAACFTGIQAARLYQATTGRQLRTIARSVTIPQTLFVVHSRVPERDREIIRATVLDLRLEALPPELAAFLASDVRRPFRPVSDADYDVVRGIWRRVEGR